MLVLVGTGRHLGPNRRRVLPTLDHPSGWKIPVIPTGMEWFLNLGKEGHSSNQIMTPLFSVATLTMLYRNAN